MAAFLCLRAGRGTLTKNSPSSSAESHRGIKVGKHMSEKAVSSGQTKTEPGEAREVMTMWPRYLRALCLVLTLTACAKLFRGTGTIIHTAITTILTITLTHTITPHIIIIPTATITTPLEIFRPRVHPGHGGGGHGGGHDQSWAARMVEAMADIADKPAASLGLSASSRKALKKRAGLKWEPGERGPEPQLRIGATEAAP